MHPTPPATGHQKREDASNDAAEFAAHGEHARAQMVAIAWHLETQGTSPESIRDQLEAFAHMWRESVREFVAGRKLAPRKQRPRRCEGRLRGSPGQPRCGVGHPR